MDPSIFVLAVLPTVLLVFYPNELNSLMACSFYCALNSCPGFVWLQDQCFEIEIKKNSFNRSIDPDMQTSVYLLPKNEMTDQEVWEALKAVYFRHFYQNGSTQFWVGHNANFSRGQRICEHFGGALATPYREEHWEFLQQNIPTMHFWIGLEKLSLDPCHNETCEPMVRWTDGTPFKFEPFMGRIGNEWSRKTNFVLNNIANYVQPQNPDHELRILCQF